MTFPRDSYTPYGYLDQPAHTRNLRPLGVLRSFDAGFRWHFPAYAGSYGGRRETYRAGMRVALDGALGLSDYEVAESPYHSKNVVAFDLQHDRARAELVCHAVGDDALRMVITVSAARRVAVHAEYTRLLSANGEWGESGLVGRAIDGGITLQGFEDGHAFVLWAACPLADLGITSHATLLGEWANHAAPGLAAGDFVTVLGSRGKTVTLHAVLGLDAPEGVPVELILARGRSLVEAMQSLDRARRNGASELSRLRAGDDAFWSAAPRLEGDWPASWRRGLVYDLETLRMMVKQPAGCYRHIWDAMQIQAPRVVLAEAAIDALLLGYADAALAQDLLLGTFADAQAPNVPCSREDGTFNMVAADGTVCGTGPQWGYPFVVAAQLYDLRPDREWLSAMYPYLGAYLDWWLRERSSDGRLHFVCSWESGQDDSPRFGEQPLGGGHPIRHVRPVDLEAAFAHAAGVMQQFAELLALQADAHKWRSLARRHAEQTEQLWDGERYADWDAHVGAFSPVQDVMQLAPVALGTAPPEHTAAVRRAVAELDAHHLTWPMFVWTAVEAAQQAGERGKAAELAWAICERAYGFWDARAADPERTLPGIACEYWPPSGRCGGEGYGWGAFGVHLVLHTLMGIRPAVDALRVRPCFPPAARVEGSSYVVRICLRHRSLRIVVQPLGDETCRVSVNEHARELAWGEEHVVAWEKL